MCRVDVLAWPLLLLGCTRQTPVPPPAADAGVAVQSDGPAPAWREPALVRIDSFDCMKHEVYPGEAPPKGLVPAGWGIRGWRAGGPQGSNWNVDQLRCTVRASTACTKGKASLTLRAGQHIVGEREAPVVGGAAEFEALVPASAWERGYDTPSRAAAKARLPYRTAAFRAQVAIDCQAPTKVSLQDWDYSSAVADEVFVAGFAEGE